MDFKLISAVGARAGIAVNVDGIPCIVKSNDVSKTGKHGHAKCRIEAVSVVDGKKKVFVIGGHERLESPMVNKRKAQILSVVDDKASVMDLESYETIELTMPEELKDELKDGDQLEYWESQGYKIIKKKI
jgi:translation initiation factor 5A